MLSVEYIQRNNEDFVSAMNRAGIYTNEPILSDGLLRRFYVEGDRRGTKNGFYVLFDDAVRAGAFGCWKRGVSEIWCARTDNNFSAKELRERRSRIIQLQNSSRQQETEKHSIAKEKAVGIWALSSIASDNHPYLVKKKVKSHGLRIYKGLLVIPMRDASASLHSLQFIDEHGNKRFLSGGRKKGCYFALGTLTEEICIAEGYATAASIHEATRLAVAVAFDAGNLCHVAQILRAKFPGRKITICADNDIHVKGNPGLSKARAAANLIGAYLAIPPCPGDFNDLINGVENE